MSNESMVWNRNVWEVKTIALKSANNTKHDDTIH